MQETGTPVGLTRLTEAGNTGWDVDLYPLFSPHLIFLLMHPGLSKHSPVLPPSFLSAVCLSLSSLCSPGLVWYHACMHHGPANKLHRVATPLPLSLSCQVEPLKHSPSSPLHYTSIHPSLHLLIQSSPSFAYSPSRFPSHHFLYLYTHQGCRNDLPLLHHSPPFIHPSIHPSPVTSSLPLLSFPSSHTDTLKISSKAASLHFKTQCRAIYRRCPAELIPGLKGYSLVRINESSSVNKC